MISCTVSGKPLQCAGANKTASVLAAVKEFSGRKVHGDLAWEDMEEEDKVLLDSLCGNHTRNLPPVAFNRLFEKYLSDKLGNEFEMAVRATGCRARLEKSGADLLWCATLPPPKKLASNHFPLLLAPC